MTHLGSSLSRQEQVGEASQEENFPRGNSGYKIRFFAHVTIKREREKNENISELGCLHQEK